MKRVLVMACSATKKASPRPIPAIDLYDGPMWRTLRACLATLPRAGDGIADGSLVIKVLSARHGVIGHNVEIGYYDERMTEARAARMARTPSYDLQQLASVVSGSASVLLAGGSVYRRAMASAIGDAARYEETDGAGIGYQRQQLAR